MQLVQDWGWPTARDHMKDDRGKRLIAQKDDVVWLLKCKPSCWRLYFYVRKDATENRIVYLLAVCKQQNQEDPADAKRARAIADEIRPGGSAITLFEFPAR
jgi:hypothetical protein